MKLGFLLLLGVVAIATVATVAGGIIGAGFSGIKLLGAGSLFAL